MTLEGDVLGTSWEPIFAGWVDDFKIAEKYDDYGRKKRFRINKAIGFVYSHIMDFRKADSEKGAIFSAHFIDNVNCLIYRKNMIHHSHIAGDIICYPHSFCNLHVRENKNEITVIAHNLFRFEFYLK